MKVVAMIPARLGSKRIYKKNLRLLNGVPLISHIVKAAKNSKCFDDIYINSESEEFKSIALKEGVKFYKRDEELATDTATNDHFTEDFLNNNDCDVLIQLLPTSPFITPEEIESFTEKMLSENIDTLISVEKQQIECLFGGKPVNFDQKKITPPSQSLTPVLSYACGLMGWKKSNYLFNTQKFGCGYHGGEGKIDVFYLKGYSTIDIDNEEDFQLAESISRSLAKSYKKTYFNPNETFDADRLRVLLEDGVTNNNMDNFNKEIADVNEIIKSNPSDKCWSHTLVNSKSTCATLIAQMPGEGNRLHYHNDWDEWWLIMEGKWKWTVEGKDLIVKKGDLVFIERYKKHKITAIGPGQSIRLAVSREDVDHVYPGES